ncbi:Tetraacyldisaccharide 4'-kinase [hydrothermal vent metagenome]|uniref:tetraacyldisaccharide 4'-kinase n=1 Tax=hydrothermal vent metagenome TaxID=652676 RepID=A0A3B1D0Z5_9ZZZZ
MTTRNKLFDRGIFSQVKVEAKVISIGNITVGGAGKTPTVIMVTKLLKEAGIKAGILSRGYSRNSKGYQLISDGSTLFLPVNKSGDEIYLAAEECGVPAAVSERRVEGAQKFIRDTNVDAIVLDDAYQHRWLDRDLNVLVFDQRFLTKKGIIDRNLLPLGRMREPFSSVDRADVVIVNRKFTEKVDVPKSIIKLFEGKKLFYGYYVASGVYDVKNHQKFRLNEFEGEKSLVVCGIARPYSFLKILEQKDIDISNKLLFKDHKEYKLREVNLIRKKFYETNSNSVVTTQKDFVKLKAFAKELDDIDIYYLKIDMLIEQEEKFKEQILKLFN